MSTYVPQPTAKQLGHTLEESRILGLPRWSWDSVPDYTSITRLPGGTFSFRTVQNAAFHQMLETQGLVAELTMGDGKGLICHAGPELMRRYFPGGCERPLVLVPSKLKGTYWREQAKYAKHFALHPNQQMYSYHDLSTGRGQGLLERIKPDWIFCDEAAALRNFTSARTKRFFGYLREHPEVKVVFLSGTMTRRSILDYAHFVKYALGERSFLPVGKEEVDTWSVVLDENGEPAWEDLERFRRMGVIGNKAMRRERATEVEKVRTWFSELRKTSIGSIVSPATLDVDAALEWVERKVTVPHNVQQAIDDLEGSWTRPDGEELMDIFTMRQALRQTGRGFHYYWSWPTDPDGFPIKDEEWLEKRALYHRAVRTVLGDENPRWDSPMWVIKRLDELATVHPIMKRSYDGWLTVKHRPTPPTHTNWISSYMLDDACNWAIERLQAKENGIIWFKHRCVGKALAERGIPTFMESGKDIDEKGKDGPIVAASIAMHGEGKNLQYAYNNCLYLETPETTDLLEQSVARIHRSGQPEDLVRAYYYAHTQVDRDDFNKFHDETAWQEAHTGKPTRVQRGDWGTITGPGGWRLTPPT